MCYTPYMSLGLGLVAAFEILQPLSDLQPDRHYH
jgi:hypothetical protein